MSHERLSRSLLLPEQKFIKEVKLKNKRIFYCEKVSEFEVCPKCATKSSSIYDRVTVTIKDLGLRFHGF